MSLHYILQELTNEFARSAKSLALARYKKFTAVHPETLVSGSDDHTLMLWPDQKASDSSSTEPLTQPVARIASLTQPVARMIGHSKVVIKAVFSPDGQWIASAGFDKYIKIWNGRTGA